MAHVPGEQHVLGEEGFAQLLEGFLALRSSQRASIVDHILGAEALDDVRAFFTGVREIVPFVDQLLDGVIVQKYL
jgi:hypothetical protein